MNQSLTPNISSHGRSRGGLKNLENLIALDRSRHIYGTVTWSGVRGGICLKSGCRGRPLNVVAFRRHAGSAFHDLRPRCAFAKIIRCAPSERWWTKSSLNSPGSSTRCTPAWAVRRLRSRNCCIRLSLAEQPQSAGVLEGNGGESGIQLASFHANPHEHWR